MRAFIRTGVCIIGLLGLNSSILAESLSWSDCLEKAKQNNLTISSSKHSVESSKYLLKASYFNLLPTLNLSSSYRRAEKVNQYDISYTAKLELPTLKDYYSIKSSKISLLKEEVKSFDTLRSLRSDLAKAFVELAFDHKKASLLQGIVKRMEKNKRLSEMRFKSGDASTPKYNVQEQEQRYLKALADLNQNKKQIEIDNQVLKDLLLDSSSAVYYPNVASFGLSIPSKEQVLAGIEEHPDIKSSKIEVQRAELDYKKVRSDFLPTLSVSSSYTRSKVFDRELDNNYIRDGEGQGWEIRASLTLPVLSSIETYARTQSSNELYKGSKLTLDQKRLTIKQSINSAYNNYENSLSDLELANKDLNIQKTKATMIQKKYEIGKGSYDDWSDSQEKLTNAELTVIRAELSKYMSLIDLKNKIGE